MWSQRHLSLAASASALAFPHWVAAPSAGTLALHPARLHWLPHRAVAADPPSARSCLGSQMPPRCLSAHPYLVSRASILGVLGSQLMRCFHRTSWRVALLWSPWRSNPLSRRKQTAQSRQLCKHITRIPQLLRRSNDHKTRNRISTWQRRQLQSKRHQVRLDQIQFVVELCALTFFTLTPLA